MTQLVIFTDLDGTLLNHHTYDYDAVCPLLAKLQELEIPLVLNSSKTLSELEVWRQKLKLNAPVIAENGGVILVPSGDNEQTILIGRPYEEIREVIQALRNKHGWKFEGFGDWTLAEVMNHTSLRTREATLAKEREVVEPILWEDTDEALSAFQQALAEHQLQLKKGGRFWHVMGYHDKADAMQFLVNKEYFSCGNDCTVVALGDSDNDLSMLNYAQIPVVMPRVNGEPIQVKGAMYITEEPPHGWVSAVETILNNQGIL